MNKAKQRKKTERENEVDRRGREKVRDTKIERQREKREKRERNKQRERGQKVREKENEFMMSRIK